jgi:hypothetical protein
MTDFVKLRSEGLRFILTAFCASFDIFMWMQILTWYLYNWSWCDYKRYFSCFKHNALTLKNSACCYTWYSYVSYDTHNKQYLFPYITSVDCCNGHCVVPVRSELAFMYNLHECQSWKVKNCSFSPDELLSQFLLSENRYWSLWEHYWLSFESWMLLHSCKLWTYLILYIWYINGFRS